MGQHACTHEKSRLVGEASHIIHNDNIGITSLGWQVQQSLACVQKRSNVEKTLTLYGGALE